jgi:hypothetical protein
MNGWITLDREILRHWIYSDAENFRAWVTILMEVNHSEQKVLMGSQVFTCGRGESYNSLETWGKLFGNWGKSKTKRFLDLLKSESMIETENVKKTTRLSVCNYSKYQDLRNDNETQVKHKRNASETQVKRKSDTNNNENNVNHVNNENNENNKPLPEKSGNKEYSESFEKFWAYYGRKGNKVSAYKQWKRLSEKDLQEIRSVIGVYIESRQDLKYRLDAEKYLNPDYKRWNDTIVKSDSAKPAHQPVQTEFQIGAFFR